MKVGNSFKIDTDELGRLLKDYSRAKGANTFYQTVFCTKGQRGDEEDQLKLSLRGKGVEA